LNRQHLVEVGRGLGVSLPLSARKEKKIEAFLGSAPPQLPSLVGLLQHDELTGICRHHGPLGDDRTRFEARQALVTGELDVAPAPVFTTDAGRRELPQPGDRVRVRTTGARSAGTGG
jgi:hypothetical protein